jgi:two-component system, response regulator PdtaR
MKSAHLLIADDDRVILATLSEDLIAHGYQVQTAFNGAEAVAACKQNRPDLAILDIRMPVMSGIDAARVLREECSTPALFLSAYSDNELVDKAVAEGALGYLVKPINTEKLLPAISAALARAEDLRSSLQTQQNLTQAMKSKREIDVAIGMLLERFNLNRDQSFHVLRRLARSANRKIEDVATDLISRGELLSVARKFAEEVVRNPAKNM